MTHPLLAIDNLSIAFRQQGETQTVVHNLSLEVAVGETLALVGESGSGKSISALSVLRLLPTPPASYPSGDIRFHGQSLLHADEATLRGVRGNRIAMIFQEPMVSLNPLHTLEKQLYEVLSLHRGMRKQAARGEILDCLERVGIRQAPRRLADYPHQLSGGERQRVMIAMALLTRPELLIADEPTTALDVTIQAQILELMQDLRKKLGMSIIMITHDLGVVASMCEKIAVMYAGHIVEYGTTDEIFYQPGHEYTKGLINSIPKLNTAEHERLVPIEGTPVDLLNPPAGCPFAPRCKNCMKICLSKMPPRTELSDTHYTYCWLQQKAEFEKGEKAE